MILKGVVVVVVGSYVAVGELLCRGEGRRGGGGGVELLLLWWVVGTWRGSWGVRRELGIL